MKKTIIHIVIIILSASTIKAQNTIYDFIQLGEYQVGLKDTILFDSNYQYEAFGYKGLKPHFVKIWYPLTEKAANPNYLAFKDFYQETKTNNLSNIQLQLNKNIEETVVRDFIKDNPATGELNDFGHLSHLDVMQLIGETKTRSIHQSDFKSAQFPVILYHHGLRSFSFENFAMAEYFASRGFIFVAANFHLPYENTPFGLNPFDKIIKHEEEQSLQFLLQFAQKLSNSNSVFFIGHSWGAQMGLRTFDNDTTIKGLISLETTIEYKTDYQIINEYWPEVFKKLITEKASYPFPILFCAATGQEKPFTFFEKINAHQVIFAPTKNEFEHNAYLSSFYLRLFLHNNINQTDKEILKDRLLLYNKHLTLIDEFIGGILKGENIPKNKVTFVKND